MKRRWWTIPAALIYWSLLTVPTETWACGPDIERSFLLDDDLNDRGDSCNENDPLVRNNWPVDRPCAAISTLLLLPVQEHFAPTPLRTDELVAAETTARFGAGTPALAEWRAFQADPLTVPPPHAAPRGWVRYQQAIAWMWKGEDQKTIQLLRQIVRSDRKRSIRIRALYMLGNISRNLAETDAERVKAAQYYRQLRADVRRGVPDELGLALASLRQEALTWEGIQDGKAARLCREYVANGGRRSCVEVRAILDRIFVDPSPEKLLKAAKDPVVAAMVSVWLVTDIENLNRPTEELIRLREAWMQAVDRSGQRAVWVAPAMARLAYDRGDWALAARWAARGDKRNPLLAGVRAQLGRRSGDDRAVISALSQSQHLTFTHGAWLARAFLNQQNYRAALATMLRVGDWESAAWIAERVMTVEELRRAIPKMPPLDKDDPDLDTIYWMSGSDRPWWDLEDNAGSRASLQQDTQTSLSLVLARRLARLGRWTEAVPLFPADLQPAARAAAEAWNRMQTDDPQLHAAATLAFFDAVLPQRFALLATETAPDYARAGGWYAAYQHLTQKRLESSETSADERARLLRHTTESFPLFRAPPNSPLLRAFTPTEETNEDLKPPIADRRYHFLWHLAELAWTAADGLPQGDPKLVQLLCRGGRLLRHRAPEQADLFYKRMIWEGRPDPVAQVADGLRWFAPVNKAGACVADPWPPWMNSYEEEKIEKAAWVINHARQQREAAHQERMQQATLGTLLLASLGLLAGWWRRKFRR